MDGSQIDGVFSSPVEKGTAQVYVNGKFEGIESWNPESPNLYDMKVSLFKNDELIILKKSALDSERLSFGGMMVFM